MPRCGTCSAYARGCRCDACKEACRQYDRERYARNAERNRQLRNARYKLDHEKINEARRQARKNDLAAARARGREDYAANRAKRAAEKRQDRIDNPDRVRRTDREWRARTDKGRLYAANRRARQRAAFVEEVDPVVVFKRDDYICQGCGLACPVDAKWPRRDAATLDHIVPLANGGEHSYANAQTLCFRCNTSKGNRPTKTPPVCDAGRKDASRVTETVTSN